MASLSFSQVKDAAAQRNFDSLKTLLNPLLGSLAPGLGGTPTWVSPTLAGGWKNLTSVTGAGITSGSGGAAATIGYNLDASGRVNIKGFAYNASGGSLAGAVYSLPMGSRPRENRSFVCRGFDGTNPAIYFGSVLASGIVEATSTVGSAGWIDLEFSFQAEQ